MSAPLVILGTGLAGWTVAREFRKLDPQTPIVLVSRDEGAFYSKPMLSNALASGKTAESLVNQTPQAAAAAVSATLLPHREALALDTTAKRLTLDDREIPYGQLVLAQGAEPIRLALQGDGAPAVVSVNDLTDYARFRAALPPGGRVTVLGAGLIGCEFANDLVLGGYSVDVVDLAALPLSQLVPEAAGRAMLHALQGIGVRFHLGASARAVHRRDGQLAVELVPASAGAPGIGATLLTTDLVLSAVGLRPRTALARAAGLSIGRGILVDHWLRTSHRDVYALGDCAEMNGQVLPYVLPIMTGARALAKSLAGAPTEVVYPVMPVAVKTPALPLSIVPPAPGMAGQWHFVPPPSDAAHFSSSLVGHFVGQDGALLGFVLAGTATAQRAALARAIGQPV